MKKISFISGCVVAIALVIYLGFALKGDKAKPSVPKINKIAVNVAKVTAMNIPQRVFAVGTLAALKEVNLSAEVDGRVTKIYFKDGDFVSKGRPIIQLDDSKAKADLASAKAALNLSKTTYERKLAAFNDGGISAQDIDTAKADVVSKNAALQASQAALAQTTIRAPFDGVLGAFKVNSGDFINQGNVLVTFVDKHLLKVKFTVPGAKVAKLQLGEVVNIRVAAYPKKVFHGKVSFIAPSVNEQTASLGIQATINNKQELLSPGMFAHIQLIIGTDQDARVIPEQAILTSLQGDYVFRIVAGKAVRTPIHVVTRYKGYAQISKGLQLNDVIVTAGQQKLQPGVLVRIVPAASPTLSE